MGAENKPDRITVTIYRCGFKKGIECLGGGKEPPPSKSAEDIRGDRICRDTTKPTDDKSAFKCDGAKLFGEEAIITKVPEADTVG